MKIQGDSGVDYEVVFSVEENRFVCSCPDFKYRKATIKDGKCKHIERANLPTPLRADGKKKRAAFLPLVATLEEMLTDWRFEICGSFRRESEFIGDIDVVVLFRELFQLSELKERILLIGQIKSGKESRIISEINGIQVDFRFVYDENEWGAMLAHCTGSREENIRLRQKAKEMGYSLNEYGLWKGEEHVAGLTEESIYESLGETFKAPKER